MDVLLRSVAVLQTEAFATPNSTPNYAGQRFSGTCFPAQCHYCPISSQIKTFSYFLFVCYKPVVPIFPLLHVWFYMASLMLNIFLQDF